MTDSKLLDSSIWLEYFHNKKFKEIIESEELTLLSALSIFEIKRKLLTSNESQGNMRVALDFLKKKSLIIPVTEKISETAVEISIENNVPMADSIIYISALQNQAKVLTLDNHFRKLKNAEVLN